MVGAFSVVGEPMVLVLDTLELALGRDDRIASRGVPVRSGLTRPIRGDEAGEDSLGGTLAC